MSESTHRSSSDGRVVLAVGLVLVAGVFGAILGHLIPAWTGTEAATVLSITFAISPTSVALYGIVAVGTFVATLAGVFEAISRFDEDA